MYNILLFILLILFGCISVLLKISRENMIVYKVNYYNHPLEISTKYHENFIHTLKIETKEYLNHIYNLHFSNITTQNNTKIIDILQYEPGLQKGIIVLPYPKIISFFSKYHTSKINNNPVLKIKFASQQSEIIWNLFKTSLNLQSTEFIKEDGNNYDIIMFYDYITQSNDFFLNTPYYIDINIIYNLNLIQNNFYCYSKLVNIKLSFPFIVNAEIEQVLCIDTLIVSNFTDEYLFLYKNEFNKLFFLLDTQGLVNLYSKFVNFAKVSLEIVRDYNQSIL